MGQICLDFEFSYLYPFIIWILILRSSRIFKHDYEKYIDGESFSKYQENLRLEYQDLREERNRNTSMNYQIMAILLTGTFIVLFQTDISTSSFKSYLLLTIIVILSGVYFIDRKLTFFNNIRVERMKLIEGELEIYNLRLTDENKFKTKRPLRPWLYNNISISSVFLLIILYLIFVALKIICP